MNTVRDRESYTVMSPYRPTLVVSSSTYEPLFKVELCHFVSIQYKSPSNVHAMHTVFMQMMTGESVFVVLFLNVPHFYLTLRVVCFELLVKSQKNHGQVLSQCAMPHHKNVNLCFIGSLPFFKATYSMQPTHWTSSTTGWTSRNGITSSCSLMSS
jgi:hypothetical protein